MCARANRLLACLKLRADKCMRVRCVHRCLDRFLLDLEGSLNNFVFQLPVPREKRTGTVRFFVTKLFVCPITINSSPVILQRLASLAWSLSFSFKTANGEAFPKPLDWGRGYNYKRPKLFFQSVAMDICLSSPNKSKEHISKIQ